jgi:hypothetical protein
MWYMVATPKTTKGSSIWRTSTSDGAHGQILILRQAEVFINQHLIERQWFVDDASLIQSGVDYLTPKTAQNPHTSMDSIPSDVELL